MNKSRILLVVVAMMASVWAGCGEKNKVGDDQLLDFKEQAQDRLGATTSTVPVETTLAPVGGGKAGVGQATTTAPPTTQAPVVTTAPPTTAAPVTTTTARQAPVTEIAINSDGGASQFDPSQAAAFVGGIFRWTNKDSVPRSVEADDGSFRSPMLAPGESFDLKASRAGTVNYHDGTRPYAVAAIQAVAR